MGTPLLEMLSEGRQELKAFKLPGLGAWSIFTERGQLRWLNFCKHSKADA